MNGLFFTNFQVSCLTPWFLISIFLIFAHSAWLMMILVISWYSQKPQPNKNNSELCCSLCRSSMFCSSSRSTIKDLFTTFDLFVVIVIPCVIKRRTQNCTLTGSCKNPLQIFGFILIISAPFQRLYVLLCAAIFLLLLLL